jgi:hypothetical protein
MVLLCAGCGNNSERGVALFSGFSSYQNPAQFEKEFPDFRLVEDIVDAENIQQYKLDDYEVVSGKRGVMIITFFNRKLMQVLYYPDNCEGHKEFFSRFKTDDERVEYIYGNDYKGRCYSSWSDKLLQSEYDYLVR